MIDPEDRVLIAVINRVRDLAAAQAERWYRIPVARAPRWIEVAAIGFYLSRGFGAQNGGVHYYARVLGHELARRRDLIPTEPDHPRAADLYYRIALGEVLPKQPPILNPTGRAVAFLYSTWGRFSTAETLAGLYA
jgi:hypothetical protein